MVARHGCGHSLPRHLVAVYRQRNPERGAAVCFVHINFRHPLSSGREHSLSVVPRAVQIHGSKPHCAVEREKARPVERHRAGTPALEQGHAVGKVPDGERSHTHVPSFVVRQPGTHLPDEAHQFEAHRPVAHRYAHFAPRCHGDKNVCQIYFRSGVSHGRTVVYPGIRPKASFLDAA